MVSDVVTYDVKDNPKYIDVQKINDDDDTPNAVSRKSLGGGLRKMTGQSDDRIWMVILWLWAIQKIIAQYNFTHILIFLIFS